MKTTTFVRIVFFVCLLPIFMVSCTKKITVHSSEQNLPSNPLFLDSQILVLYGGEYIPVNKENKPVPAQGEDQFYKDMYLDFTYPAVARNNSIQGTVMFEVIIDEQGTVQSITKTNSLSPECDLKAQSAIERGCERGFEPYNYKGSPVQVKYFIPVNFRLR